MLAGDKNAGTILIVVLMVMALLGAIIVEFAYGIYVSTSAVHNWSTLRRASVYSESGLAYGVAYIDEVMKVLARRFGSDIHTYPGRFDYAVTEPFPGEPGDIAYTMEDETGKLNVNQISMNVVDSENHVYQALRLLCQRLEVPESAREFIRDWVDSDSDPKIRNGEVGAKNGKLWSLEELYDIPGLEAEWIHKLLPYLTIYGDVGGNININAADETVLYSLFYDDETAADSGVARILEERERKLGITKEALSTLLTEVKLTGLTGRLVVRGTHFRVTSTGRIGEIRRTIETVLHVDKNRGFTVIFWRET